jgi:hypothetical protein
MVELEGEVVVGPRERREEGRLGSSSKAEVVRQEREEGRCAGAWGWERAWGCWEEETEEEEEEEEGSVVCVLLAVLIPEAEEAAVERDVLEELLEGERKRSCGWAGGEKSRCMDAWKVEEGCWRRAGEGRGDR